MAGPYTEIPLGSTLSQLVENWHSRMEAVRSLERSTWANQPTIKVPGLLWNRADDPVYGDAIYYWSGGGSWRMIHDPEWVALNSGGTVAYEANQFASGYKLYGLGLGSVPGDSVAYDQAVIKDHTTGDLLANLKMGGFKITGLGAPVDPGDAARKADIPTHAAQLWQQSNRDQLGNGKPVVWEVAGLETMSFVEVGFVPRSLRIRLKGQFHRQDNNDALAVVVDDTFEVTRWNADSTGDFAGTAGTVLVATIGSPNSVALQVTWKYTEPLGFWLRAVAQVSGSPYCVLRRADNGAVDGHVQCQALFGVGT